MYPPKFEYHRPDTIAEALQLAQETGGKFLAGGHSLIPVLNQRLADPGTLIDIGRLSQYKGILSDEGSLITLGALTTHAMVAASAELPRALSEAAGMIGDPQVRNRGTVGGNIAHADPASDLPTVLLALKATIATVSASGSRMIPADEFFTGLFATALEAGEMVAEIGLNREEEHTGSAYVKMANPASRYAMIGAAAQLTLQGNTCTAASVAVGGLTPKATRTAAVEAALVGRKVDADTLAAAAAAVAGDLGEVIGDMHASAAYRRQVAPVFVRRALETAVSRAR